MEKQPIYQIKNSCGVMAIVNSMADARQFVFNAEEEDKKNNLFAPNRYTIVKISGGIKLIGANATFPCKCYETGKRIYRGEGYFFDVVNKRTYHSSADIVRIYYSNSLTQ